MSLTTAVDTCDLPGLIAQHCGTASVRGLGPRGGTIRDPRPGMAEANASFSVWVNALGTWMWKKRGRNSGQGTAFNFLLSLGLSTTEARKALLAFTGQQSTWEQRDAVAAPAPRDILAEAKRKLADVKPVLHRELDAIRPQLKALRSDDAAAQELARRGLWLPGDLQAVNMHGDLAFLVRGPDGRPYNLKRRRLEGGKSRYQVVFPGLSTPAWCSPKYGKASRLLIVEGELNAAAAWRVITTQGLDFDVQGLPGTDTWPFLEGMDREVWIYADGDSSGESMRARIQELAFAAGATRVHQVPALAEGDFCDVLGSAGVVALSAVLHAERPKLQAEVKPALENIAFAPQQPVVAAARMSPTVLVGQPLDMTDWPMVRR